MTTANSAASESEATRPQPSVDRGSYEIIRDRLRGYGSELKDKAESLNASRLELFGGVEFAILGNARIRTEHNCVPRDVVEVSGLLLFGYNVFIGLKKETAVEDVFSLHEFEQDEDGYAFPKLPPDSGANFLADPQFVADFRELYQYYKHAYLMQLRRPEGRLLAVFRIGEKLHDIRVFRWAVSPDGRVDYIDNRGEREHVFPPTHDFEWTPTDRDDHVSGAHPHINILDQVFVETVGGDLTIKVENNTDDGQGVYRESVADSDQALDDAEILFAKVGTLILLKVLPYRESEWRYLVFNTRTRQVNRIDAIGQACVGLPEDHGIIFPGGYYLQSGETKSYDADTEGMEFLRIFRSPNGEDVLFAFHQREQGRTLLLPYNMIRKQVVNLISCHGLSLFPDGRLVIFRAESEEPTRVHAMQIWSTPFMSDEHAEPTAASGSFLEKVGNADLVRGISDCLSIVRMVNEQVPTRAKYEDLIATTVRVLDAYYWLDHKDVGTLRPLLHEVHGSAELIIDEFDKVEALRRQADEALAEAETRLDELTRGIAPERWQSVDQFVDALGELRLQRGHLITLKEMRYIALTKLDELEAGLVEQFSELSANSVEFLLREQALVPYREQTHELETAVESLKKVAESNEHRKNLEKLGQDLGILTEVVGSLEIEDATQRTTILEQISELMGSLNRARALGENKRTELLEKEGVAEFGVQFQLLSQSVVSAISLADSPDKCDQQLSKVMLQLEELESRFSEFDTFLEQLTTKREEVYDAFATRKQTLVDKRQRRAENLMRAAERILVGVIRRAETLESTDQLNAFYASDPMVAKLRSTADELRELEDSVHADEVASRLKSSKEDAARGLRDRRDIFEDGSRVIRLGRHRFSVNSLPLELTMVPRNDSMALHLTGTSFYEMVEDDEFQATQPFWSQELVSETDTVYRGEYLATSILYDAEKTRSGLTLDALHSAVLAETGLVDLVRDYASGRYDQGYERGIHDADAARILERLLAMRDTAALLRFTPSARAQAVLFWSHFDDEKRRTQWESQAISLQRLRNKFEAGDVLNHLATEITEVVQSWTATHGIAIEGAVAAESGRYLAEEIARHPQRFVLGADAEALKLAFVKNSKGQQSKLAEELQPLHDQPARAFRLVRAWLQAFAGSQKRKQPGLDFVLDEAAVALMIDHRLNRESSSATVSAEIDGLLGQHRRIDKGKMTLRLDELLSRLGEFRQVRVPAYRRYQTQRHELLERQRRRLRLEEYRPKVMSSFVRNKLVNDVYLPVIGDNLAKQIGALGANKRTDLMGLLLLISPPGYGKTTLMEYLANRLGLVFMKINGPALGHSVHSLDPNEAPNATARQEVEKLNLAFEMGNNVLLYVDDIQHTHPEFLQKFISLCDAQRKIEGVWRGETRTYDLRGRKFCVCMAGNPYTESGEKFQIPDMLANRADTYNLGDILEGKDQQFALSYIENALTSNSTLAPLTTREQDDIYKLVRLARGEAIQADQLSHEYSSVELTEIRAVLEKLIHIQSLLLAVNQQYIVSASQRNAYRTEPAFRLQGSYRNMNKLAEKIVPAMNQQELERLIDDHYASEAQTLTSGAEENLLKLAEMRGRLTSEQAARWAEIKLGFARMQRLGTAEDDPATRLTAQLGMVSEHLETIGETIARATSERALQPPSPSPESVSPQPPAAAAATATPIEVNLDLDLDPYLAKLNELLEAVHQNQSIHAVKQPPSSDSGADHALISREAYLIQGTLIPLLRFMAHRFRGYRGVDDPKLKQVIASLEMVDDVSELVRALEKINVNAIATLTEDDPATGDAPNSPPPRRREPGPGS